MCIVCIEVQKERMTRKEALRALGEMVTFPSADEKEEERTHYLEKLNDLSEQEAFDAVSYYDIIRLEGEGG